MLARDKFINEQEKNPMPRDKQDYILKLNASELRVQIFKGILTSEQITKLYLLRIARIGMDRNFIADINFELALQEARTRDLQL